MAFDSARATKMLFAVALLALLGISSYFGAASQKKNKTVSAVISRTEAENAYAAGSLLHTAQQLEVSRERELALLDEIIDAPAASQENKQAALSQKRQIAENMEREARTDEALARMGWENAKTICAGEMVSVFLTWNDTDGTEERARLTEAICAQTGAEAQNIRIIFTKK